MSHTVDTQMGSHASSHRSRRTELSSPAASPTRSTSPSKRASSPNKLRTLIEQGIINEEAPSYISAMEKIYECAWKFDRSKDETIMKSLDNRELAPDQFRQILHSGMNCKLTNSEFAAIRPLLDNAGNIDGAEFILLFYRLRFEHRAKHLKERVIADKLAYKSLQTEEAANAAKVNTRKPITLTDFTKEDLQSAEKKMMDGAVRYDRLMPGASPLDGFDVESMDAAEFNATIRAVFHIKLTIPELSAYILTNHNERGLHRVNCANFLLNFFRNGFIEKTRRLKELWAKKKEVEVRKQREKAEKEKELEKKNALQVDFNFSEADRKVALVKLRTAAKLYDKTTPGAMSMKAFEVKEMPPHVFKEQLKRIFNLKVTPAEMGALMSVFDVNGDGVITCEEFTKVFINMGFEEREKELKAFRQMQHDQQVQQQERQKEAKAELDSFNAAKVAFSYTDDEWESAMFKLKEAAWRFDRTMPSAPSLECFEQKSMPAHELKDQLKRVFYLKLTPQELGAIMKYFDSDDSGCINCAHFLKKFLRLGYEERMERKREYRVCQEHALAERQKREHDKLVHVQQRQNQVLGHTDTSYTEEDFQSAFAKVREAAMKFNKSSPSAGSLEAFETLSMPAHVFREQLKLVFNIKVNLPELFALVAYFARAGVAGEIDCAKFVITFLQIGYTERERMIRDFRKKNRGGGESHGGQRTGEGAEAAGALSTSGTGREGNPVGLVNYTFTEEDLNSMLEKLIRVCMHNTNARSNYSTSSNVGHLMSFQSVHFSPQESKNLLKSVFGIHCNARELGGFVRFFDVFQKGAVHVQTLMNTLLQIKFKFKQFQGARTEERAWMESVREELKAAYQQRITKTSSSTDLKPWRSSTTIGNFMTGAVFKRRDHSSPTEPVQKLILRLLIARRTHRLDVSCKFLWDSSDALSSSGSSGSSQEHGAAPPEAEPSPGEAVLDRNDDDGEPQSPAASSNLHNVETASVASLALTATSSAKLSASVSSAASTALDQYFCAVFKPGMATSGGSAAGTAPGSAKGEAAQLSPSADAKDGEEVAGLTQLPIEHAFVDFRLHTIPADVFKLSELRELWLDNHRLTALPRRMSELPCLEVLSLRNNLVESIPADVCQCSRLRRMYVSHNRLSNLPNVFGKLKCLEELDISSNQLSDFPEVLTSLPHLHVLDISHNSIAALPLTLVQMRCLYVLRMENLRCVRSPPVLSRMPFLEVVGLPTLAVGEKSAKQWVLSPAEDFELVGMIKGRAAIKLAERGKTRRV